jgi:hypothetical protein
MDASIHQEISEGTYNGGILVAPHEINDEVEERESWKKDACLLLVNR